MSEQFIALVVFGVLLAISVVGYVVSSAASGRIPDGRGMSTPGSVPVR